MGSAGEACSHYSRSVAELNKILLRIRANSNDIVSCEHCREEPAQARGSKQSKKKGGSRVSKAQKEANFVWVCLDCNRYFCGGEVSNLEPYGHARRHSKQEKHLWAARSDDPLISWCYACNSKVPIEMPTEEVRNDLKLEKETDSVAEPLALGSTRGYVVRGLFNLGNTCFFNSIMQNLFATDVLREYFLSSERPFGPITMALRKIFIESDYLADSKGVMTPKALFGSICEKQPQFRGYQQQDSHELLRVLLAGLDMEETSYVKSHNTSDEQEKADLKSGVTFVDAVFGGQISSTVCCMECGFTSVVHEPFLDLSLPVPSKKSSSVKKAPPLPPKRSKAPLREKNKVKNSQPKMNAKDFLTSEHGKEESSDLLFESRVPVVPELDLVEVGLVKAEEDFSWMDYIDNVVSKSCKDGDNVKCPDMVQIPQSESTAQCTSDSHLKDCFSDLIISSESSGDNTCGNLVPSSCIEDSSVLLLPYKESNPIIECANGTATCSQAPENVDLVDAPVEEEFDGFGDMFNEPEVTSVPKNDSAMGKEVDLTKCTGNSSDSNQDEVDNTNSPVSINSCLALFTKPEILSDEQAWLCDRCSENAGPKAGKLKTVATLDEGKSRNKMSSSNLEVGSCSLEVLGDGMLTFTSKDLVPEEKRPDDPNTIDSTSQKLLHIAAGSEGSPDIQNDGSSNYLRTDVEHRDQNAMESDSTSQYKSWSAAFGNNIAQQSSITQENGFCCTKNIDGIGYDGEWELSSSSACEIDTKSEVNQLEKKCLHVLEKGCSTTGKSGDEVKSWMDKVKRVATKRILIYRTPSVLTIHLKRFSQDARGRLSKLSGHVGFSEALDLRPYMDPRCEEKDECQYQLIGVVEHSGTMSGGHYIAYVRGERGQGKSQKSRTQAWFHASDTRVREATLSEVLNSDAYILFFRRVST